MVNMIFCAACAGEEFQSLTVQGKFFIDFATTPKNVKDKIMKSIRKKREPPKRVRKCNQFSEF